MRTIYQLDSKGIYTGAVLTIGEKEGRLPGWIESAIPPPVGIVQWLNGWVVLTEYPPPPLAEVVAAKRTQLIAAHEVATYADVTVSGKVYPCNREYQLAITAMASRQGRGRSIPATIRGKDGVPVTLTPPLLGQIEDAIFNQGSVASDNLSAKIALVNAAITVAQINSVAW